MKNKAGGVQRQNHVGRAQVGRRRRVVAELPVAGDRIGAGGRNDDVFRVEQQRARGAQRRTQVDRTGEVERLLARHLGEPAVAALRSALRGGGAVVARAVVGPDGDRSTVAAGQRIGMQFGAGRDEGLLGVAYVGVGAVEIAADADRAAGRGARGVDDAAAVEQHALPFDGDLPAALAGVAARRVDLARDRDDAFAAAVDHDAAGAVAEAARLHHADHVEDRVGEGAARFGAHLDACRRRPGSGRAAAGGSSPRWPGLEEDEAVAFDVDRHRVRRDEPDAPAIGVDGSGVGRRSGPASTTSAAGRVDHAFVAHLAAFSRRRGIDRGQVVAAGEEVAVAHRQARDDQPADVDARTGTENHAVRVDQEDLPVRRHLAEDLRRVVADHPVERDRRARRLVEAHLSPAAIEKLCQSMIALSLVCLMTS